MQIMPVYKTYPAERRLASRKPMRSLEFRRHFTEWNRDALQLDPRYCGKILARNGIVASRSMHFWHAGLRRAAWDRYHPHTYVHMCIYRVCRCLTAKFCRRVLWA